MSREIKFRQPNGKGWHYWGLLEKDTFTGPIRLDTPSFQYTGLLDHHGKEIYESDIIRFTTPRSKGKTKRSKKPYNDMAVVWGSDKRGNNKNGWHVVWRYKGQNIYNRLENALDENHEVIGNIWQNPELLEQQND